MSCETVVAAQIAMAGIGRCDSLVYKAIRPWREYSLLWSRTM